MFYGIVELLRMCGLGAPLGCRNALTAKLICFSFLNTCWIGFMAELELFLVQAWIIWNQRNIVIHGGKLKEPSWLNKRAVDYLDEY